MSGKFLDSLIARGNYFPTDEDLSRRKKNAASGETLESGTAGQGTSEGERALYHCNYCNKDITGKVRIKCAMCPDFDLCIECFSVGAEVTPHKSNHPYRVMDNLCFPLICPDWNADDEILLLEGIEMYGMGNWAEVAEHVGTKNKEACIEHYRNVYLDSPFFPLPDMSHVVGKNRKELLAMAKGQGEDKKVVNGTGISVGDFSLKEESPFSPSRVKVEDSHKAGPTGRLLSGLNSDVDSGTSGISHTAAPANQRASNATWGKDGPGLSKMEGVRVFLTAETSDDRNFGGKKSSSSNNEGPSLLQLSGYNPKRQEFDPEYDNDAEQLLAEMEFKDTDSEVERELMLRVLRIFNKRLDERKRRKDFILERNLLYPSAFEKNLTAEETALCRQYEYFMRFHSKEDHQELLQTIINEHRIRKRIQELKEGRAAGCRTSAEADRYLEQKRRRQAEENARRAKESAQVGQSNQGVPNVFMSSDSTARSAASSSVNEVDVTGADLLSENEKRLCCELRLPPATYLRMQEVLTLQVFSGNISTKSDAHHLFRMETSKIDRVYDMLVKKGIAPPCH
ncbi:transcriptional adapter ADA2b [Senna tora]|uniref:Transcriptional adapter n=1 Tax=Senna tora TaxID=362788 RepID=A0A834SGX6_9FABA|nr:transcriptional adapter ADA2b [Senna tora]